MKIEIPGFILISPHSGSLESPTFAHSGSEMREYGYLTVCPYTLVFDLPDGFDPHLGMVDVLREKKSKVLAEAQQEANKIEESIQRLLAIEFKG
jgi:hypothetical protein